MNATTTLRAFIAIPLPDTIISQLDRIQKRLQRTCPYSSVRWVKPRTIHLTLYFIGDMLDTKVSLVRQALSDAVKTFPAFDFTVENLGTFPNSRRPNIIWAGVEDRDRKLSILHKVVNECMAEIGFSPENRQFTPHLTIGRVNRRASREDKAAIGAEVEGSAVGMVGVVNAQKIVFYRSILKPTGAEHIPLAECPFK